MNIYTLYSPSHQILFQDYFLKTLPIDLDLIPKTSDQICKSGRYFSKGWGDFCYEKVKLFLRVCEENYGKHFIVSDVDVQFFVSKIVDILLEEIEDYDIACQRDATYHCSGFFICKANDATLSLFQNMVNNYIPDDQNTLNKYVHTCKHKFLSNKFYNIRQNGLEDWRGKPFELPSIELYLHHANWTIGVENKIKLLNIVRDKYESKRI